MAFSADSGAFKKNARIPSLTPIFCETFLDIANSLIAMMIFRSGLQVHGISQPRVPLGCCVGHNWFAHQCSPQFWYHDYASRFFVDSGACKHVCKDEDLFTNMTPTKTVVVSGDGSKVHVGCNGDLDLPTAFGITHLTDVLYVPVLSVSLFFIACADSRCAKCTFLENNDGGYIKKLGALLCSASYINGLYWIEALDAVGFCPCGVID